MSITTGKGAATWVLPFSLDPAFLFDCGLDAVFLRLGTNSTDLTSLVVVYDCRDL